MYNKINGLNLFVCSIEFSDWFLRFLICGPELTAYYGHTLCSKIAALVKNEIRYKYLFISLPF